MKRFEMDCIEVTEADGGGMSSNHIAYVSTQALADILVSRSKGWRSSSPYKKVITVYETIEEVDNNTKAALIRSAKAKLSPAELQALGLQ